MASNTTKGKAEFVNYSFDVKVEGKPFRDKDDNEIPGPLDYGKEVGKVVATSNDLTPRYKVTGKELYVRARVVSDKKHPNPFKKGDVETAWKGVQSAARPRIHTSG